jgi:hypothetical protein
MVTGTKKLSNVIGVMLALIMIVVSAVPTFAATSVGSIKTLKASNNGKNVITLKWSRASHATSYRVYKKKGSKYVRIKTLKGRSYKTKISRTTYFKVRGVRKTKLGKMSKAVKAAYKKQSSSKKLLVTTDTGVKVYKDHVYSVKSLGVSKSSRKIIAKYATSYWGTKTVRGYDADTHKPLIVAACKKTPKLALRYDELSVYNDKFDVDMSETTYWDYFDFYNNGDGSYIVDFKKPGYVMYETIDGTEPSPDNYYTKITNADGTKHTYAWAGKTGYGWYKVYKGDRVVYEQIDEH